MNIRISQIETYLIISVFLRQLLRYLGIRRISECVSAAAAAADA